MSTHTTQNVSICYTHQTEQLSARHHKLHRQIKLTRRATSGLANRYRLLKVEVQCCNKGPPICTCPVVASWSISCLCRDTHGSERIWSWPALGIITIFVWIDWGKRRRTSVRIVIDQTEIQTKDLASYRRCKQYRGFERVCCYLQG
jgi:hypothetical protein